MFITSTISLSSTILQTPTPTPTLNNNLVNSGSQNLVYIGVFLLAISLVIVIGIFSKKIEYALIFAATLTVILIAFFWFL
jgi:dipeptide/tripeptide permease